MKVGNRRHAVGQEHRQVPVDQVHVGVDQAGEDRPAVETNDVGVRRNRHLSSPSDRGDAIAFDNHHGVSDRGVAGAVNQRPAFEDEYAVLRRGPGAREQESDDYPADPRLHSCLTFAFECVRDSSPDPGSADHQLALTPATPIRPDEHRQAKYGTHGNHGQRRGEASLTQPGEVSRGDAPESGACRKHHSQEVVIRSP